MPNGGEGTERAYALRFGWRSAYAQKLDLRRKVAICGDINIAPEAREYGQA